jgi:hypothetical protein
MRFFLYSPLDMSEQEAFDQALPHLSADHMVYVTHKCVEYIGFKPGQRPQALPNTYLVRVEQDGSLRVVQRALS